MGHYLSFLAFATAVAVAPGPDSFLTLRNTMVGGRTRGLWTAAGITSAGITQGVLAAVGLGAVIARSEVVFQTIRWAGVVYLTYLGVMAIRTALRGDAPQWGSAEGKPVGRWTSVRQGFLCNITNPKVLAFNLAVLPQFAGSGSDAGVLSLVFYALTLAGVGLLVLLLIVAGAQKARQALQRKKVQRGVEIGTGTVFVGFAAALATEA